MPDDDPILDYARPGVAPKRPLWRSAIVALMAVLTLVVCVPFLSVMVNARGFARGWKQYGHNPALLPQIEADARHATRAAAVVFAIAAAGWGAYFVHRWRSRRRR